MLLLRFPHQFDRKKMSIGLSSLELKFTLKTLIQNPGQITRPSINLKVVLKRKSILLITINESLSSFDLRFALKNFVCKIHNCGQITQPNIDLKVVLKRKLAKDFKKVGSICCNLSYKSQLMKV
jgi:hypothetical protein